LDLCQRLKTMGWKIVMTPRAKIIHLVGGGQNQSPRRILLIAQARMHFFRKYWSRPKVVVGGALVWLHAMIRVVAATVAGRIVGGKRAEGLKHAYEGIVFKPESWWHGYQRNDSGTK